MVQVIDILERESERDDEEAREVLVEFRSQQFPRWLEKSARSAAASERHGQSDTNRGDAASDRLEEEDSRL